VSLPPPTAGLALDYGRDMPFGFFKRTARTVHVEFVDDSTGETFGRSDVPLERLPDSFALETTLDIGEKKFNVMDAQPQTKDLFAKTGTLRLRLRQVEMMDPKKILFSLPSICASALPDCAPSEPARDHTLLLHKRGRRAKSRGPSDRVRTRRNDLTSKGTDGADSC